nr:hypothetical protein [Bacillus licheniformis]
MHLCRQEESTPSEQVSEDIEWANEMEKETALVFEKGMLDEGHSEPFVSWAVGLWKSYCAKKAPVIKKTEAFAYRFGVFYQYDLQIGKIDIPSKACKKIRRQRFDRIESF